VNKTMDISVVGGSGFTLGFMLAGIKKVVTVEADEHDPGFASQAEKIVDDALLEKDTGIVIIDETLLRTLNERMREKVERSVRPVFVPVSTEASQETLRRMIIKSIGVDLMRE